MSGRTQNRFSSRASAVLAVWTACGTAAIGQAPGREQAPALPSLFQPQPQDEESVAAREALRAAIYACDREQELDPEKAVELCRAAVAAAERVPAAITRSFIAQPEMAVRSYLRSLVAVGRLPEASDLLEDLIARRLETGIVDLVVARDYVDLARIEYGRGAFDDTDMAFSRAVTAFETLVEAGPPGSRSPGEGLTQALREYAVFKRIRGEGTVAAALEARAAAVVIPGEPADPSIDNFRPRTRRAGDVTIVETTEHRVSDDDLRQIQSILAPERPWWLDVHEVTQPGRETAPSVYACVAPVVGRASFRRGRCASLVKTAPDAGGPAEWRHVGWRVEYVQIDVAGGDASARPPLLIHFLSGASPPTDEMVIGLVMELRRQAVPTPTTRRRSDVQPWSIVSMTVFMGGDIDVALMGEDFRDWQSIRMRPEGDEWRIVEMR